MFDFLTDPNFVNALAAIVGPLAFFAAPTEEIEHLLLVEDFDTQKLPEAEPMFGPIEGGVAKAA